MHNTTSLCTPLSSGGLPNYKIVLVVADIDPPLFWQPLTEYYWYNAASDSLFFYALLIGMYKVPKWNSASRIIVETYLMHRKQSLRMYAEIMGYETH
jgi:hypothetical protein